MAPILRGELLGPLLSHTGTPQARDPTGILCSLAWLAASDDGESHLAWALREARLDASNVAEARNLLRKAGIANADGLPGFFRQHVARLVVSAAPRNAHEDVARLRPCRRFPRHMQLYLYRATGLGSWAAADIFQLRRQRLGDAIADRLFPSAADGLPAPAPAATAASGVPEHLRTGPFRWHLGP